jgi:hypothetical protein
MKKKALKHSIRVIEIGRLAMWTGEWVACGDAVSLINVHDNNLTMIGTISAR